MNSWSVPAASLLGGLLAGLVLPDPAGLLPVSSAAVAPAAVVAVLVCTVPWRFVGGGAVVVGAVVVATSRLFDAPSHYATAVGAGLVVGGVLAGARGALPRSLLMVGVLTGSVVDFDAIPRRYADYLESEVSVSAWVVWILLLIVPMLVVFSVASAARTDVTRGLLAPALVAVALIAATSYVDRLFSDGGWRVWLPIVILAVAVIWVALWVRAAAGLILLAGLSIALVEPGGSTMPGPWWAMATIAVGVVGVLLGRVKPVPLIGFGALALSTGPALFEIGWAIDIVPMFIAGYLIASCLTADTCSSGTCSSDTFSSDTYFVAAAALFPLMLSGNSFHDLGWTAYSTAVPLVSEMHTDAGIRSITVTAVVVACFFVAWRITRSRSGPRQNGGGQ